MSKLDKNQKVAIVALGCVAIFVFIGAAWQFETRLTKPFNPSSSAKNSAKVSFGCQGANCQEQITSLMTEAPATASGTPVANDLIEVPARLNGESSTTSSVIPGGVATNSPISLGELSPTQQTELQNVLSGQTNASSLRALMIAGGADKKMLDKISDQDLMKIYQDSLNNAPATNGASSAGTSTTSSAQK